MSNQAMFQVVILRHGLSEKLANMPLQQRKLHTDSFWSERSWFLQDERMKGLNKDLEEIGAVSGDTLTKVASKAEKYARPAQRGAAGNILYILENCERISDIPPKRWFPSEEVLVEAVKQNELRVVGQLLKAGVKDVKALTHGLQQAVNVGNARICQLLLQRGADAMSVDAHQGRLLLVGLAETKGFSQITQMLKNHIQLCRSCSAVGLGKMLPRQLIKTILDFLFTEEKEYGHRRALALKQDDIKKHSLLADEGLLLRAGHSIQVKRAGDYVFAEIVAWHPARDGADEHYVVKLATTGRVCEVPFKRPGFEDSIRTCGLGGGRP